MSHVNVTKKTSVLNQEGGFEASRRGRQRCWTAIAAIVVGAMLVGIFIGAPVSQRHSQGLPGANVGMGFLVIAGVLAFAATVILASRAEKHHKNMWHREK